MALMTTNMTPFFDRLRFFLGFHCVRKRSKAQNSNSNFRTLTILGCLVVKDVVKSVEWLGSGEVARIWRIR